MTPGLVGFPLAGGASPASLQSGAAPQSEQGESQVPLGKTGESGAAAGYLGFAPFLEEVCVSGGELGHVPLPPLTVVGEQQADPITARLSRGWSWRAQLGQCASGECDCTAGPWVCEAGEADLCAHTPVPVEVQGHSQDLCQALAGVRGWAPPAPVTCAHTAQCAACGGGEDGLQPVPLALSSYYISTGHVLQQAWV